MGETVSILASYPDLRAAPADAARALRVVGLDENDNIVVGRLMAGEAMAVAELTFALDDAGRLAERCLSGDARALTTPGLARYLSAALVVMIKAAARGAEVLDASRADGPSALRSGGASETSDGRRSAAEEDAGEAETSEAGDE